MMSSEPNDKPKKFNQCHAKVYPMITYDISMWRLFGQTARS